MHQAVAAFFQVDYTEVKIGVPRVPDDPLAAVWTREFCAQVNVGSILRGARFEISGDDDRGTRLVSDRLRRLLSDRIPDYAVVPLARNRKRSPLLQGRYKLLSECVSVFAGDSPDRNDRRGIEVEAPASGRFHLEARTASRQNDRSRKETENGEYGVRWFQMAVISRSARNRFVHPSGMHR